MFVKLIQFWKVLQPNQATELGDSNITLAKLEQSANALMPISVMLFGMVIEVMVVEPVNPSCAILVTGKPL
jgi:hypothetical protein